jgi:hypothetical protein
MDRRLHGDHEAICPVLAQHRRFNLVAARKPPSMGQFFPKSEHPIDQPPFSLHKGLR